MGANYITIDPIANSVEELKKEFDRAVDQSRFEDGNSYSGEIGMTTGLITEDTIFYSRDDARTWLFENVVKWEEAKAVRYRVEGGTRWLIGASCAS